MLLRSLNDLLESSIDFAKQSLDPTVWASNDIIREDVKKKILETLDAFDGLPLRDLAKQIRVVGSIGTNQYTEDADIDVHLVIDPKDLPEEKTSIEWLKTVKWWFDDNQVYIGKHPVEVFLQYDPETELLFADAAYDLIEDKWIVGPTIVPDSFDPFEMYDDVLPLVYRLATSADIELGALSRDCKDYDMVRDAFNKVAPASRKKLADLLRKKVEQIDASIDKLAAMKDDWRALRRQAGELKAKDALSNQELKKQWEKNNAAYKFLQRYKYISVIEDLEAVVDDGIQEPNDIERIEKLIGAGVL